MSRIEEARRRAAGAKRVAIAATGAGFLEAAGYDQDFDFLHDDDRPPGPPSPGRWRSLRLGGRPLSRPPGLVLEQSHGGTLTVCPASATS